MEKFSTQGTYNVDYGISKLSDITCTYKTSAFILGGMPEVSQKTLKKFTSGYNGCLQDFTLAEDYRLQMVQSAQNGRNVRRCS